MSARTRSFALQVLRLCGELHGDYVVEHYRVAQHAISTKDFFNKMKVCEAEADETCYWLQLLVDGGMVASSRMNNIIQDANEIAAIISASCVTARARLKK